MSMTIGEIKGVRLTMAVHCLWYLLPYDGLYSPVYSCIFAAPSYPCARILWMSIPSSVRVFMNFSVCATPFVLSASTNPRKSSFTSSLFSPSFRCTKLIHIEICSFLPESVVSFSPVTITYGCNRHKVQ